MPRFTHVRPHQQAAARVANEEFRLKLEDASNPGRGAVVGLMEEFLFQQSQMTGACDWGELYGEEFEALLETASTSMRHW